MEATARIAEVAPNTVSSLLVNLGEACAKFQNRTFRNLTCKRLECDEIWSFVGCKQKNLKKKVRDRGDVWTWIACDPETKLVPCWFVGPRDSTSARLFMKDLAPRLKNRIQISTDGLKTYVQAIEDAFGADVDYGVLDKKYGTSEEDMRKRYEGAIVKKLFGNPEATYISTSFVERQNLTMRMSMRRFTRKTNAFSKKIYNHSCAIALHFMNYNFVRIHSTLRVTPAMEAGISDHVWDFDEILKLIGHYGIKKTGLTWGL